MIQRDIRGWREARHQAADRRESGIRIMVRRRAARRPRLARQAAAPVEEGLLEGRLGLLQEGEEGFGQFHVRTRIARALQAEPPECAGGKVLLQRRLELL